MEQGVGAMRISRIDKTKGDQLKRRMDIEGVIYMTYTGNNWYVAVMFKE